jgi:iron complex outermembrane receptor protein
MEHGQVLADVEVVGTPRPAQPLQSSSMLDATAQAGRPLGEILSAVNGVATFSNGATLVKPVVHGLSGARVLTLANGIRQEDQQWGTEHALAIDPLALEAIRVVRGAAGVRYGPEAMGGAVVMEPAPLRSDAGTSAIVRTALFSNNGMGLFGGSIEHRFQKMPRLALRVQGSGRRGGNYALPGSYRAANTALAEGAGSLLTSWRGAHSEVEVYYSVFRTSLGLYRGSHTGNQKDLEAAVASPIPLWPADFSYAIERPWQQVTHHLAKAKAAIDTRIGRASITYGFQYNLRREYDVQRIETDRAQLNLSLVTQTLHLALDHRRFGAFSGSVGAEGVYAENRFEDGDRVFLPFYDTRGVGAYAIERYRRGDWTVEAGLRWDVRHYDVKNPEGPSQGVVRYERSYSAPSVTLGARREWGSGHVGATLSGAWRAPQPAELFAAGYHQSAARVETGNRDLVAERAYGVNIDAERHFGKLGVEATFYHQRIADYIYLQPGPGLLTIRGFFRTFQYAQTDAALTGTDLTLSYDWTDGLTTTAQASLLRARDVAADDWIILIPPDRFRLFTRYALDLGRLRGAYVSVDGRYVAQQTRVPQNFDAIDFPRPPARYFLLGAEVGSVLHFGKQPLTWSLAVSNALNTRYRDYLDAFRYFLDRPGRDVALRVTVPFSFQPSQKTTQ